MGVPLCDGKLLVRAGGGHIIRVDDEACAFGVVYVQVEQGRTQDSVLNYALLEAALFRVGIIVVGEGLPSLYVVCDEFNIQFGHL